MDNPKIRDIIVIPVEVQGKRMLLFQDPERYCEQILLFPFEYAPILQYFDGNHSFRDIQVNLMRATGELIYTEDLEKIAKTLDEHFLLDSERFQNYVKKLKQEWADLEVRPPALSGSAYPSEPKELEKFLEDFFAQNSEAGLCIAPKEKGLLKGLIVPHLDLRVSGNVYACGYKRLLQEAEPELIIILGTAHSKAEDLFVFCKKDFQTPFGIIKTDKEFIEKVEARLKKLSTKGDFSHSREHSIELQTIFIQYIFSQKKEINIVPILVDSFHQFIQTGLSPEDDPLFKDYSSNLREVMQSYGKQIVVIASADLAHLGPKYGDKETYAPVREDEIKADDLMMLEPLKGADPEGFFFHIARIKDKRKICGLGPIYTLMKILAPQRGELFKWHCWYDSETFSAVSCCAMGLY